MRRKEAPEPWREPIERWLASLRSGHAAPATVKVRGQQLGQFARAHAELTLEEVTLELLEAWLDRPGWSASSRHGHRMALRSFFDWAEYTGRSSTNPARRLRKVKVPAGRWRPAGELTVRRAQQHDDERIRRMMKLASVEGMRVGEIARVHTDDVVEDLVGHSLRVHGKGGRIRIIPLDDEIARDLLSLPRGYVFPGRGGQGHLQPQSVSRLMSAALPDGATGHMLRHRAAGRVYEGTGRDLRATQEFLGHASVATTQIYTPANVDRMRAGVLAAAG